jgi:hypothetical protein
MEVLAATLTRNEQDFAQLTALTVDPAAGANRNLATFIAQDNQLGALAICASGAASQGTNVLSATVLISNVKTSVDVYRLPLAQ